MGTENVTICKTPGEEAAEPAGEGEVRGADAPPAEELRGGEERARQGGDRDGGRYRYSQ